jgi:hypothetical protein
MGRPNRPNRMGEGGHERPVDERGFGGMPISLRAFSGSVQYSVTLRFMAMVLGVASRIGMKGGTNVFVWNLLRMRLKGRTGRLM